MLSSYYCNHFRDPKKQSLANESGKPQAIRIIFLLRMHMSRDDNVQEILGMMGHLSVCLSVCSSVRDASELYIDSGVFQKLLAARPTRDVASVNGALNFGYTCCLRHKNH